MRADRRTVLRTMTVTAGALLLPVGTADGATVSERRALAALSRLFSDADAVRVVGSACRGSVDRPTIGAVAADFGTTVGEFAALDRATLRRRVDRRIRADFAAGRVAAVDGWVLARTEARLYALIAAAG